MWISLNLEVKMDYISAKSELVHRVPSIDWKAVAIEVALMGSALVVMMQF